MAVVGTTGRPYEYARPIDTTRARRMFIATPATRMRIRAGSGFDSNHRCSGTGFGPNGIIAFGS
jgi:hypothetical protein